MGREKSVRALEEVMAGRQADIIVQPDGSRREDDPEIAAGIYQTGVLANVLQLA